MSTSNLHSTLTSAYLLAAAALGIRRISARPDWTGEKSGHFEHPAIVLPQLARTTNNLSMDAAACRTASFSENAREDHTMIAQPCRVVQIDSSHSCRLG